MKEYTQLRLEERRELYRMQKQGMSEKEMALTLDRDRSTISRELARNSDPELGYLPDSAHAKAQNRKHILKPKVDRLPELKVIVVARLRERWSPEMIAGEMRQRLSRLRICHESIYQFIYSDEGQRSGLYHLLIKGRPVRKARQCRTPRTKGIVDRVSIHKRPEHIEKREEFGHYEGDLTFNKGNQSANLLVVVERKTRYAHIAKNDSKHTTIVMKNMFNKLAPLPSQARKTATFDNGTEFSKHTLLRDHLGMQTYFCDPYSAWQKGQVEKTNDMLRRFIPKNIDLTKLTEEEINQAQERYNNMPRKCLGFMTPNQMFWGEVVALQT